MLMQGAGTIAQLVHACYPDRVMHGWELDPAVVDLAQQHMGMQQLTDCGCLVSVMLCVSC
jgi:spermidine synthase